MPGNARAITITHDEPEIRVELKAAVDHIGQVAMKIERWAKVSDGLPDELMESARMTLTDDDRNKLAVHLGVVPPGISDQYLSDLWQELGVILGSTLDKDMLHRRAAEFYMKIEQVRGLTPDQMHVARAMMYMLLNHAFEAGDGPFDYANLDKLAAKDDQ